MAGFPGPGIYVSGDARNNVIGGDRNLGTGPFGQGNQLIHNSDGVFLATQGTSRNVIKGNLIGTDTAGIAQLGNELNGMRIDGANGNTIGPDNIIAHNGGSGILLYGRETVHNTITRNSIYDNGNSRGIELLIGANTKLIFPNLLDFDLSAGTVAGVTCNNCTVEFFSDDGDEGAFYEGSIVADSKGVFSFDKGTAFTGPHLTATATDLNDNTSEFSPPAQGTSRSLTLQQSNHLGRTQIQPKHSEELADNRMGMATGGGGYSEDWVEGSKNKMGIKWAAEFSKDPLEWSGPGGAVNEGYSEYSIDPWVDLTATQLKDLGIEIVYNLQFWDEFIEPEPCYSRFRIEEEIQRYLDYVQWLVQNFKDRVQIYSMFNEPLFNPCRPFDQQTVQVDDYIALVRRVIPTIQQEHPDAKLVIGAVVLRYEKDELMTILESDLMPLVDGISWHPFYGQSPELEPQYYYDYPATVQAIKDLASANGFSGEYFVEEIEWRAENYGEVKAAKYLGRGITMHLGMDIITSFNGTEPLGHEQRPEMHVARNLATIMAGVRAASLPVQIQTSLTNTVTYTFAQGDDRLVGLWSDGIATEYDPGVPSTLTIPGLGDYSVTGIDVLHGYRQPLISENVDGDLIIRDLFVVDYPILLSLSAP
jgi:hypothetical protein